MTELVPVLARIGLRYLAGALVTYGILAPEDAVFITTDPEIVMLAGLALGAVVEGAYAWARRHGGAT
jgi:hypothetical protein